MTDALRAPTGLSASPDEAECRIGAPVPTSPGHAMGFLADTTVLILTYNEEQNIARTLDALAGFPEIVVLDSGSTDATRAIARRHANVRVATRAFDQHAAQWNFGLTECAIERSWVLALDADYVLPASLVEEISALPLDAEVSGFRAGFRYCMHGRPLSAALYPPHVALFRRARTKFVQDGHTQRPVVDGAVGNLRNRIDHDDRKPLSRWFASQQNYARLEAEHLLTKPRSQLRRIDRLRLMAWPAPLLVPVYTLIVKRCFLDGWPGWLYVLQRMLAELMIAIEIVDRRLRNETAGQPPRTISEADPTR